MNYRNHLYDNQPISVASIRGKEQEFSLEQNGFEVVRHSIAFQDFDGEDAVKEHWWPAVAELIKKRCVYDALTHILVLGTQPSHSSEYRGC